MNIGLKTKLYISFLLVITLPIGALVGFHLWSMERMLDDAPMKIFSPYLPGKIASEISQEYIRTGSLADSVKILERLELPPGIEIKVLDLSGRVVADTAGRNVGSIITPVEISRLLSLGVTGTEAIILPAEQRAALIEASRITGLAGTGIMFASLAFPGSALYAPIIEESIRHKFLLSGKVAAIGETLPAKHYATAPLNTGRADIGLLLISAPFPDVVPIVAGMHRTILVGGGTAVLVIIFLGWLLSSGIIHPLKTLTDAADRISREDFDVRVTINSQDALGKLAGAFNHMADELQRSQKAERVATEARKELIVNIAHDLRTPLSSIRGYVEGLQDGIVSEPQKVKRYLEVLHNKTVYLERLISDLFQLSKVEAVQMEMKYIRVGATGLLNELSEKFDSDFYAAGILFSCQIAPGLPVVEVDRGRIEQVLSNLVANALNHTSTGDRVTLEARLKGSEILVCLANSGEDIEPEDLLRIFDRFYRGDKSRSSVRGGTGLGLFIARQIIEAHGGRIWAESVPGEGSSFTFTLPVISQSV